MTGCGSRVYWGDGSMVFISDRHNGTHFSSDSSDSLIPLRDPITTAKSLTELSRYSLWSSERRSWYFVRWSSFFQAMIVSVEAKNSIIYTAFFWWLIRWRMSHSSNFWPTHSIYLYIPGCIIEPDVRWESLLNAREVWYASWAIWSS